MLRSEPAGGRRPGGAESSAEQEDRLHMAVKFVGAAHMRCSNVLFGARYAALRGGAW